jgi:hypothetical protein
MNGLEGGNNPLQMCATKIVTGGHKRKKTGGLTWPFKKPI